MAIRYQRHPTWILGNMISKTRSSLNSSSINSSMWTTSNSVRGKKQIHVINLEFTVQIYLYMYFPHISKTLHEHVLIFHWFHFICICILHHNMKYYKLWLVDLTPLSVHAAHFPVVIVQRLQVFVTVYCRPRQPHVHSSQSSYIPDDKANSIKSLPTDTCNPAHVSLIIPNTDVIYTITVLCPMRTWLEGNE